MPCSLDVKRWPWCQALLLQSCFEENKDPVYFQNQNLPPVSYKEQPGSERESWYGQRLCLLTEASKMRQRPSTGWTQDSNLPRTMGSGQEIALFSERGHYKEEGKLELLVNQASPILCKAAVQSSTTGKPLTNSCAALSFYTQASRLPPLSSLMWYHKQLIGEGLQEQ